MYHSTLGLRVIKKKKKVQRYGVQRFRDGLVFKAHVSLNSRLESNKEEEEEEGELATPHQHDVHRRVRS